MLTTGEINFTVYNFGNIICTKFLYIFLFSFIFLNFKIMFKIKLISIIAVLSDQCCRYDKLKQNNCSNNFVPVLCSIRLLIRELSWYCGAHEPRARTLLTRAAVILNIIWSFCFLLPLGFFLDQVMWTLYYNIIQEAYARPVQRLLFSFILLFTNFGQNSLECISHNSLHKRNNPTIIWETIPNSCNM